MPVYPYHCPKCDNEFDVAKRIAEVDRSEQCSCGEVLDSSHRLIAFKGELLYTAVEDAEYNPGLGCVVKNRKHREQICRDRGLIEVGNDDPNRHHARLEKERDQRSQRRWAELTEDRICLRQ